MNTVDVTPTEHYAGFWPRLGAAMLDMILVFGIATISFFCTTVLFGEFGVFLGLFIYILGAWLYFAAMESSPMQATLGKKAFGIMVVGEQEKRISFKRASLRFGAKVVCCVILGIGFILAAFSKKNRAIHDRLAGTYTIKL
jgi:uncharacterized RDD family membrane protein YckC